MENYDEIEAKNKAEQKKKKKEDRKTPTKWVAPNQGEHGGNLRRPLVATEVCHQ